MATDGDQRSGLSRALGERGWGDLPPRSLEPDEALVHLGDRGGDAYLLETGHLHVVDDVGGVLAQITPGDLVGEYVALVGGERTATIVAAEASVVRVITRLVLEDLLASSASLAAAVRDTAVQRILDTRLHGILGALLATPSPGVIDDIAEGGSWRHLAAGEQLFAAGEPARSGFVVVSGRLRRVSAEDEHRSTGYLAAGSVVGEEGFAGSMRQVSMAAVRDSVVLEIPGDAFTDLLVEHPRELAPLALRLSGGVSAPRRRLDRTIAVAVTTDTNPRQVTSRLADQLGQLGDTAHLWSTRVDARLDRPGIAQAERGDPTEIRLLEFLAQAEQASRYLVLEPDVAPSAWSSRVLRQCDVLAIVASADPTTDETARVDRLLRDAGASTLRVLVLVHPTDADRPRATAVTMRQWAADHVLHVRAGSVEDSARVARTLAGQPVGLVLGGGGARGFAGLGVFRAMRQLGIPVDAVGASSIGAPLGAGIATGLAPDAAIDVSERGFHDILDYTVPLVSLLKGERTSESIRASLGGWDIEDLWLPYFCVSTNLTQGRMQVHRSGDVVTAARASVAIPGAFPPVPFGDDLLVDGGVTNNLPADVMRRLYPTATIVAVSVAPAQGPRAKADYGLSVSGWQAMKSKVGRGPRYPGIVAVLMRSMITGSMDKRDAVIARGDADLLLDIDMRGVGLLDFERVREVAGMGYDAAMPRLEAWLDERRAAGEGVPGVAAHRP